VAETTLSIGEVAARAGVNVSAIRYYERRGLLPEADRCGGRRRFGEETVRRLGVIEVAKRAGFALDEVRELLDAVDRGAPAHEQLQDLAGRKLAEVEELIERARSRREWLAAASRCSCKSLESCGLFAAG
jgi:MerR family transcriptional regulator, redox-sensitive transcriptional activator SoxR